MKVYFVLIVGNFLKDDGLLCYSRNRYYRLLMSIPLTPLKYDETLNKRHVECNKCNTVELQNEKNEPRNSSKYILNPST